MTQRDSIVASPSASTVSIPPTTIQRPAAPLAVEQQIFETGDTNEEEDEAPETNIGETSTEEPTVTFIYLQIW